LLEVPAGQPPQADNVELRPNSVLVQVADSANLF